MHQYSWNLLSGGTLKQSIPHYLHWLWGLLCLVERTSGCILHLAFRNCMLAYAQHSLINVAAGAPAYTLRCLVGDAAEGSTTRTYMGEEAVAGVAEEAATVVFCP